MKVSEKTCGLSYVSVHKATKTLKFYPYCVHGQKKMAFILAVDLKDKVHFVDEAWFHTAGYVNS
jgi:hypothetical protein